LTRTNEKPVIAGGTPIRDDFLDFARPMICSASIDSVAATLRSGWLTTGPRVEELELYFADMQDRAHAIGLNSCTAGLFLALKRIGVGPGDEVITTPITFAASANVIIHAGATPVFVDVAPDDWYNIDARLIEAAITPKTRAMIPVHYAGRPVDIEAIQSIADKHGIATIGDCAHAVEGECNGEPVGKFFDYSAFSFYANKNATCGEGGMVCCDDADDAAWFKIMRLHGMDRDAHNRFTSPHTGTYDIQGAGYKFNMPDISAAILKPQLEDIEPHHDRRRSIWESYNKALSGVTGITVPPADKPGFRHALHVYSIHIDPSEAGFNRDDMARGLLAENIGVGVHYTPVHLFTVYRDLLKSGPGMLPVAEDFGANTLSLPLTPYLTDKDIGDVTDAFIRLVNHFREGILPEGRQPAELRCEE
jgi:dTDP-4-amino-4,6-dideoxygalactose transaminase